MQLVFATQNTNKLEEVQKLLPSSFKLLSLKDIGCYENLKESKNTLEGNAFQKAEYVKSKFGFDCFADDTGLFVNALDGAPGVYSARYAGKDCDPEKNMNKLLKEMAGKIDRSAYFKTVISLIFEEKLYSFEGICQGEILHEKAGDKGFGYDPIFKPLNFDQSFAEMDLDLKNRIGHRGKAVKSFIDFLSEKAVNI